MKMIDDLLAWLNAFFLPKPVPIEPIAAAKKPAPARPKRGDHSENFGTFYYLDDVLDCLDSYVKALAQLKRSDQQAYREYRQVGGRIIGRRVLFQPFVTEPAWKEPEKRPSFGMVHFYWADLPIKDDKDMCELRLLFFRKLKSLPYVQRVTGASLYEVKIVWEDKKGRQMIAPFYVAVDDRGNVQTLRWNVCHWQGRHKDIPQKFWEIPNWLVEHAQWRAEKGYPETPERCGAELFLLAANTAMIAAGGIQVLAKKGNITACFDIEMTRTAYFFKNREKTVTVNGRTARIFHIARTHRRTLASGKEIFVRTHFRGLRKFIWKGYEVTVTMPGLHHAPINEFNLEAIHSEEKITPPGMIPAEQGMKIIADQMQQ